MHSMKWEFVVASVMRNGYKSKIIAGYFRDCGNLYFPSTLYWEPYIIPEMNTSLSRILISQSCALLLSTSFLCSKELSPMECYRSWVRGFLTFHWQQLFQSARRNRVAHSVLHVSWHLQTIFIEASFSVGLGQLNLSTRQFHPQLDSLLWAPLFIFWLPFQFMLLLLIALICFAVHLCGCVVR